MLYLLRGSANEAIIVVKWDVVVSDTVNGEANYRSVYRYEMDVPSGLSRRALVRRIKAIAGYSGIRGATWYDGDAVEIKFPAQEEVIIALART